MKYLIKNKNYKVSGIKQATVAVAIAVTLAIGAVSVMSGMVGTAFAADYGEETVPPGIKFMREPAAKEAYIHVIGLKSDRYAHGNFLSKVFSTSNSYFDIKQVNDEIAVVDPAVYVTAQCLLLKAKQNFTGSINANNVELYKPRDLGKLNPAMEEFRTGLYAWFQYWAYNEKYSNFLDRTETHLANAMFMPAYPDSATGRIKAKEFIDEKDLQKKTALAQELTKRYMSMKGYDKTSLDPNNAYNRHLLAQWAAFWLDSHYQMSARDVKDKNSLTFALIVNNIEYPLMEKVGYYIRSFNRPQNYFNNSI